MRSITLITGESRGIGAQTAKACAEAGHILAINYNVNEHAAQSVAADIRAGGGTALIVRANVAIESDVVAMFDFILEKFGRITGLVNNAGIHGPHGRVESLSNMDITIVLEINVRGYFLCAREAIQHMSTNHGGRGGGIVNVSFGSAHFGDPGCGVIYAASKGAVNSLTIGLSQEVAGEGIRVNTVAPGITETDMPPKDKLANAHTLILMGRPGQPDGVAAAILWLLSNKSGYVAGANIRVSGGCL